MERGFKRAAGQDAARVAATRQLALVAWLARLGRSRQLAALLMGVVVVALLPGFVGFWELRERGRELDDARAELEQERQKSAAGSRNAAETAKLEEELAASRRNLEQERQARATADEQLKAALQPQVNVPILELAVERGAAEPTSQVRLPRSPGWIVLTLDVLDVDRQHPPSYRVILRDASGKEIWRGEGLRANERDLLYLILPSTLLEPGDYAVTAEGVGAAAPVTFRFSFRTLPAG
jgi:hypothetical protein